LEGLDGKGWHLFEEDGGDDGLRQNDPLARHQRWEVSPAAIKEVLGEDRGDDQVEGQTPRPSDGGGGRHPLPLPPLQSPLSGQG